MSSRHRQIHHNQNLSALQEQSDSSPFATDAEAIGFPKGTYVLIHKPRKRFRDKVAVLAALEKEYPGCIVGRQRHNSKFWSFEVRLPAGVAPPTIEASPSPVSQATHNTGEGVWCPGCACMIMVPAASSTYPEHKPPGTRMPCRRSGKPLPEKKEV